MKNKLIGLAVAVALAVPAIATAAPTVGGMMQVEIANVSNDGFGENNGGKGVRTPVAAGESAIKTTDNKRGRLWFKGNEDLGGGLKANYKFEWQINTNVGELNDGAREGWVGLSGAFGAVEVGRIKSPYKYTGGVTYDPFVTTYMEARNSGGMVGGDFGANGFWSNSISWKKKFGAIRVWVNLGLDEGDGATGGLLGNGAKVDDTSVTPSVKEQLGTAKGKGGTTGDIAATVLYKQSNWEAFVGLSTDDQISNIDGTADDSRTLTKVGGKFKTGAHTISAQYEMDSVDGTNKDSDTLFIGYQLKMGKNILVAQIGQVDHDVDANDVDYYALGAIHKFSKTTRAFVGYRVSDKDDSGTGKGSENEISVISAGLRIDF